MAHDRAFFDAYMANTGPAMITKWDHYFDVYARELGHLRDRPIRFLEIGIFKGGSLPMWKSYFAKGSTLAFIDIDPNCAQLEIEGTHVRIGSQADPDFLRQVAKEFGPFDVVLDDGSHVNAHQHISLETLWPLMADGGLYMVEDCHTSYWPGFGGGFRERGSFIEKAKGWVDTMHSWYTDQDKIFPFNKAAEHIQSVRFYDSIVVLERCAAKAKPTMVYSKNGQITRSQRALEVRGRTSIFKDIDGSKTTP